MPVQREDAAQLEMSAAEVETSVSEHHNPSPRERLMTMVMMGAGVGADADAPRASQSLLPARRLRANCEPRTHSDSIHESQPVDGISERAPH